MPACATSLLREETPLPMPPVASATITSCPRNAAARATASPTTPAPTTKTCMSRAFFLYAGGVVMKEFAGVDKQLAFSRRMICSKTRPPPFRTMLRSGLADPEGRDVGLAVFRFEYIAGLRDQHWNIDGGERVGAGDDQDVASLQSGERLAGPQYRQWAFEAAQIVGLF